MDWPSRWKGTWKKEVKPILRFCWAYWKGSGRIGPGSLEPLRKSELSLATLTLLRENGSTYVYQIAKTLAKGENRRFAEIKFAHIFPVVCALEENGLLTSCVTLQPDGLRRKYYSLTHTGEDVFAP